MWNAWSQHSRREQREWRREEKRKVEKRKEENWTEERRKRREENVKKKIEEDGKGEKICEYLFVCMYVFVYSRPHMSAYQNKSVVCILLWG